MHVPNVRILFLDDDQDQLDEAKDVFDKARIGNCMYFNDVERFFAEFDENVHIAIIDHYIGNSVGYDILEKIYRHNEARPSVVKCRVIVISGQMKVNVVAHYMNTRKASFYINKNNDSFYEELVVYTRVAIEEVTADLIFEQKQKETLKLLNSLIPK